MGIYIILLSVSTFIGLAVVSQVVVGKTVKVLFGRVVETAKGFGKNNEYKDIVKEELVNLSMVSAKKERLGFITIIIGIGEIVVFGLLVMLLIKNYYSNVLAGTGAFFTFLGGWLAIKTLGNYQQWAGPIFGRACFYVFIIGTILNILFAVALGVLLFYISFI